jgi:pimeloyl-ACP methyl ester carboxylesterase
MDSEPEIRHGYAQLDGIRLHYVECGDPGRELVLLLHGFPEFWYSWQHQLPVLGREFHVVAPDLRGYNLSDKPSRIEDYRMEALVGDVVGLIKHFGVQRAAVVGHDWGAAVAWAIAQRFPERVSKLCAMQVPAPGAWRANFSFQQLCRSWYMFFFQLPRIPEWLFRRRDCEAIDQTFRVRLENKGAFTDSDIQRYKESIQQPGALTAAINYYRANVTRIMFSRQRRDLKALRHKIGAPTLFIFGEKDFAIIPRTAQGVANYVSGYFKELRIPESGHWVQNEAVEKVNSALLEFLRRSETEQNGSR